jgi:hypothetical protein
MNFSLEPSTRVPLPAGVTLDNRGYLLISNDYNTVNTEVKLIGRIYFGQYIRSRIEFGIDLDKVTTP